MNRFNRAFVIVTLVLLLLFGALALVSPALFIDLIQSIANGFRTGFFANFTDIGRVVTRLILALMWIALMAGLIWLEVRRPSSRTIEVVRYAGGTVIRVAAAAVQDKVKEQVDALSGVITAKVVAKSYSHAVDIKVDVLTTRNVDLVATAEEVAAVVRSVVQDELGLKLNGKPQVTIKAKPGKAVPIKLPPTPPPTQPGPKPSSADTSTATPPEQETVQATLPMPSVTVPNNESETAPRGRG
jgi:hypothetical protein